MIHSAAQIKQPTFRLEGRHSTIEL